MACLLLIISGDPVRYRTIVSYVAVMNIVFGALVFAIDLHAGLPLAWTLLEGPPIAFFGVAVAFLNRPAPG